MSENWKEPWEKGTHCVSSFSQYKQTSALVSVKTFPLSLGGKFRNLALEPYPLPGLGIEPRIQKQTPARKRKLRNQGTLMHTKRECAKCRISLLQKKEGVTALHFSRNRHQQRKSKIQSLQRASMKRGCSHTPKGRASGHLRLHQLISLQKNKERVERFITIFQSKQSGGLQRRQTFSTEGYRRSM